MEDRETPRMRKYGESKTILIMMATVPHVNSGLGFRKFQADGFLFDRVYEAKLCKFGNKNVLNVKEMDEKLKKSCGSFVFRMPYVSKRNCRNTSV
jgi:hypothetical protein